MPRRFVLLIPLLATLSACGLGTDPITAGRADTHMMRFAATPLAPLPPQNR